MESFLVLEGLTLTKYWSLYMPLDRDEHMQQQQHVWEGQEMLYQTKN